MENVTHLKVISFELFRIEFHFCLLSIGTLVENVTHLKIISSNYFK